MCVDFLTLLHLHSKLTVISTVYGQCNKTWLTRFNLDKYAVPKIVHCDAPFSDPKTKKPQRSAAALLTEYSALSASVIVSSNVTT